MKRLNHAALVLIILLATSCHKDTANFQVIPLPQEVVTHQEETFNLSSATMILYPEGNDLLKRNAEFLTDYVKDALGKELTINPFNPQDTPKNAILLGINDAIEQEEGYELKVTPQLVTIQGKTPNGVFHGIQTLRKAIPVTTNSLGSATLPGVEIKDYPRFGYRGMHLDICRHFFPVEFVKKYIDLLALHNMNTFHWHLTDDQGWRIEIKKFPKLVEIGSKRKETLIDYYYTNYPQVFDGKEVGGYYTQEQIKDVVAYAASKYITVIPEIEMPGHALATIASYPELSCTPDTTYDVSGTWGIFEQVYCPKEETFKFLEGVLDEVVELFPSSYIHIGGDECPKDAWKACGHCQKLIKELGLKDDTSPNPADGKLHTKEEKLQSYFVTRMEKYLNSKGRNIIGWDEILEGGLAPNATVMSWRGVEGGMNAAKLGHNAIMTPSPYMYVDYYQEDPEIAPITIGGYVTLKMTYNYNPVEDDADELVKEHIIGIQGNSWTEYMQSNDRRDYQIFPKAVAIAESGWTLNKNKDWKNFCQRMTGEFDRLEILDVKACRNFFDVNINTHVEDNILNVILETYYPDAQIYYTTDGSEPTEKSTLYTQPFPLQNNIDLKTAAFKDGKMLGKVRHKPLYGNLISGKTYSVIPEMGWAKGDTFGENDKLGADKTTFGLTNGKRGNNASYAPWCSFSMNDQCKEVIFSVQLDKPTEISKVVFGSLFNPAYRVLPVSSATVEVSDDGKQFNEVATTPFSRQLPETGRKAFTDSITFSPIQATYVRLTLRNGGVIRNGIDCRRDTPGEIIQADLYIDEIEVY